MPTPLDNYLVIDNVAKIKEQIILGVIVLYGIDDAGQEVPSSGTMTILNAAFIIESGRSVANISRISMANFGTEVYYQIPNFTINGDTITISQNDIPQQITRGTLAVIKYEGPNNSLEGYIRLATKDTWNTKNVAIHAPLQNKTATLSENQSQIVEADSNYLSIYRATIPPVTSVLEDALGTQASPIVTITAPGKQNITVPANAFENDKFGLHKGGTMWIDVQMGSGLDPLVLGKTAETGVTIWDGSNRSFTPSSGQIGFNSVTVPNVTDYLDSSHTTSATAVTTTTQEFTLTTTEKGFINNTIVKARSGTVANNITVGTDEYATPIISGSGWFDAKGISGITIPSGKALTVLPTSLVTINDTQADDGVTVILTGDLTQNWTIKATAINLTLYDRPTSGSHIQKSFTVLDESGDWIVSSVNDWTEDITITGPHADINITKGWNNTNRKVKVNLPTSTIASTGDTTLSSRVLTGSTVIMSSSTAGTKTAGYTDDSSFTITDSTVDTGILIYDGDFTT